MKNAWIKISFRTDALLGRGDGVAGLVDAEVQHDEYGCPFLGGRALKGLLQEECANVLFSLKVPNPARVAAEAIFGQPGSGDRDVSIMHVGRACLPADLQEAVQIGIRRGDFTREQVLNSLTTIRRLTAQDYENMAPLENTLRSIRLVRRKTTLISAVQFKRDLEPVEQTLLAACVAGLRRVGSGRNRGHGRLEEAALLDQNMQPIQFESLAPLMEPQA